MTSHLGASNPTLEALFPAKARRALVEALFSGQAPEASMSELARRARLTPRAVAVEVRRLEQAGLVEVRAIGSAHLVRSNARSAPARALSRLLEAAKLEPDGGEVDPNVRPSLVAHGAPLQGVAPRAAYSLSDTVLRGLDAARTDPTVLRVLPVVVAKHAADLDWEELEEGARRMNLKAELGMLLELTGTAAGLPALNAQAEGLMDGRRKRPRYFPRVVGAFERQLAEERSPAAARRWNFYMNMSEESVRDFVRKHVRAT
jgi:DNA-binding transcriptional ArsR family regulator